MESKRSNMPPCPGRMFPESLIFDSRFSMDWNKSPNVAEITESEPKIIHSVWDNPKPFFDIT